MYPHLPWNAMVIPLPGMRVGGDPYRRPDDETVLGAGEPEDGVGVVVGAVPHPGSRGAVGFESYDADAVDVRPAGVVAGPVAAAVVVIMGRERLRLPGREFSMTWSSV